MSNQQNRIFDVTEEYALYPVKEVKRLYGYVKKYNILLEKIKYLEKENADLKQRILKID
ncbi:hypothetical protein [Acinetobacter qingfengensis]|uniref:hypothetical protein n=1 Tax=Acinetobacter qingfengensis TaxID=1262585 RepID=UPI00148992FA|nr:hypothetical protein [Acinetobacter qingfengensis]